MKSGRMKDSRHHHPSRLTAFLAWKVRLTLAFIAVAAIIAAAVVWRCGDNEIALDSKGKVSISPTQIESIKRIGQWEFLSVSDEELVDTVRRGFFGDDELVRIYYGTLRLGIDLAECAPGWIRTEGDTIVCSLPPVKLLDDDFIDEARTTSFFEDGHWSEADRKALYERARKKMLRRCLDKENRASAEQNASRQFDNMLHSMGFKYVKVRFDNNARKEQHNTKQE